MLNFVISNLTVVSARNNGAARGGGIIEAPDAQDVTSLLLPSGHVVLDKVAPENSTRPNNPFKFASVKSAPSIEPPAKLTMTVFSRLAPVRSAFDKSVSKSIDSLRFTLDMSAPERLVSDKSTLPKFLSFISCPTKFRPDQSPSINSVYAKNSAFGSSSPVPPVVKLNSIFSHTRVTISDFSSD